MIYEVHNRNDITSGAALVVRMPEEDLDKKALYTIREDRPNFILPFRSRVIDGQYEFTYQIGPQSKLQYLAGDRDHKAYAELWSGVLSPLIDCGDWFLKPYSFVLDINYVYCDKNLNAISYVYIPSVRDCSDYNGLKAMAADFSRQITVCDTEMENRVLRAIMMDFNPRAFLQMLKACATAANPVPWVPPVQQKYVYEQRALPMPAIMAPQQMDSMVSEPSGFQPHESIQIPSGEIIIDIPEGSKAKKKPDDSEKEKPASRSKKDKHANSKKSGFGLQHGKKTDMQREDFIKNDPKQRISQVASPPPGGEHITAMPPMPILATAQADITNSVSYETDGAWLRLVGSSDLPQAIDVAIGEGEVFTVGRYDSAVGRQQSCFEFERTTKAVSRRHAAIERRVDSYSIIDLSSSAGTFLDGQKLPPNTPCTLQSGCRVSFGNCGADYVWEQ